MRYFVPFFPRSFSSVIPVMTSLQSVSPCVRSIIIELYSKTPQGLTLGAPLLPYHIHASRHAMNCWPCPHPIGPRFGTGPAYWPIRVAVCLETLEPKINEIKGEYKDVATLHHHQT